MRDWSGLPGLDGETYGRRRLILFEDIALQRERDARRAEAACRAGVAALAGAIFAEDDRQPVEREIEFLTRGQSIDMV